MLTIPELKCAVTVAVVSLFMIGCATNRNKSAPTSIQYPSTLKDFYGIDSVELLRKFRLEEFSEFVLAPLDTSTVPLPPEEENTYEPVTDVLNRADLIILTEIEGELGDELTVRGSALDSEIRNGTLLLRGKVVEFNPGSRSARFWVGFGAGSAWVRITGEIVDAKADAVLLRFDQRRVAAIGVFGGDYERMLTDCVTTIGGDIANLITALNAP